MRCNVLDLAVVMGAAFRALVAALANDLHTPLTAANFGGPDLPEIT